MLISLSGCMPMKAIDFKDQEPRFVLETFFEGETRAWGIFEDRFGNLRRQFTVDITGTWDGKRLRLDEQFLYSDGERETRVWEIEKIGEHEYRGRADDVVGWAVGETYGNALNWRYDMDLKVGDGTLRVHFNDWMFLQPSRVLLNRARITKLGIEIGTVTLAFMKEPTRSVVHGPSSFNEWPTAFEALQAANQ
ncbi:MAG: DUF3833 domain-containing protein [Rhodospirillaceae bacterium]